MVKRKIKTSTGSEFSINTGSNQHTLRGGPNHFAANVDGPPSKTQADPADVARCVAQIREALSQSEDGKVICKVTWRGAVDAVAHVLTSAECRRVIFHAHNVKP